MIIGFDIINGVYELEVVEDGYVLIDEENVFYYLKHCEEGISYVCEISREKFEEIEIEYGIY